MVRFCIKCGKESIESAMSGSPIFKTKAAAIKKIKAYEKSDNFWNTKVTYRILEINLKETK